MNKPFLDRDSDPIGTYDNIPAFGGPPLGRAVRMRLNRLERGERIVSSSTVF